MIRFALFVATVVCMSLPLVAEDSLEAPDTARPGDLVILDAEGIPSSGRSWQAVNVPEGSWAVVDDNQRLVFATAVPGRYFFVFSYTRDLNAEIASLREVQARIVTELAAQEPRIDEITQAYDALADILQRLIEAKLEGAQALLRNVENGLLERDVRQCRRRVVD